MAKDNSASLSAAQAGQKVGYPCSKVSRLEFLCFLMLMCYGITPTQFPQPIGIKKGRRGNALLMKILDPAGEAPRSITDGEKWDSIFHHHQYRKAIDSPCALMHSQCINSFYVFHGQNSPLNHQIS